MSVQPNSTDTYCDPSDVGRYFRTLETDEGFTMDTNPTERQVEDFIGEATARVDTETGHAWRPRQVVNEYHDLEGPYYYWAGTPISLTHRSIRPLDATEGDKLEIFDGENYENWLEEREYREGRDEDYWVNRSTGQLYIYRRSFFFERYKAIRVTYRYGKYEPPRDIQAATAKLAACNLIRTDMFGDLLPTGSDTPSPAKMADSLEEQAMTTLKRYKEIRRA